MILKVKIKPGTKSVYRVYLDDLMQGTAPGAVLFSSWPDLETLGEVTLSDRDPIDRILHTAAKATLLNWLARQDRSEYECRTYLKTHGYRPVVVDTIIIEIMGRLYISDKRTAEAVAASASEKGKSRREAARIMRQKGISPELAEEILPRHFTTETTGEAINKQVRKALRKYRDLPPRECRLKMLSFLDRHGFPYDLAVSAIEQVMHEDDD